MGFPTGYMKLHNIILGCLSVCVLKYGERGVIGKEKDCVVSSCCTSKISSPIRSLSK